MIRARRVASGRAAKASGDLFEAWVEAQHAIALRSGLLACVAHNEPRAKVIGGRLIYTSAGVADYTGTIADQHGRTLAAEAKSTGSPRLARSAIRPLQARHLDDVARAGGLAVLLVEFRSRGAVPRRFAVPWPLVPWSTLRTAESVSVEDLVKWEVLAGECYVAKLVNGVYLVRSR